MDQSDFAVDIWDGVFSCCCVNDPSVYMCIAAIVE